MPPPPCPPFIAHGSHLPQWPVILSVPHAGRTYPEALIRTSRLSQSQLMPLEDRYADLLAGKAIACGFSAIVARRARAWIDLNRGEREIDPDMIDPRPRDEGLIRSPKVLGGLGLLPRRLRGSGDILSHKVTQSCLETRIDADHRPYHRTLRAMLNAARDTFGGAILLDIHSMPPLAEGTNIVIGDLFGRSAQARYAELVREMAEARGFSVAMNAPYAGGHILSAHGRPAQRIQAIQIEFDRALYLEADLRTPRRDLGRLDLLVADIARALADEVIGGAIAVAAE